MVAPLSVVPPLGTPRRHRRWWMVLVVAAVAVLVVAGSAYAAVGWYAYDRLSRVASGCGSRAFSTQTPADFRVFVARTDATGRGADVALATPDPSPYRFTDYEDVAFPARDGGPTIRAWYAPGEAGVSSPVVVLIHGRGACRRDPSILLPAAMLHRAGFGVLIPDLRNHGDSDSDNGRWAGGAKQYLDVLGAWDWLVARGHRPALIGLFGESLGAATVAIAIGEERRVAAAWLDSSYASMDVAVREFAVANGFPAWVADPAIPIGRLLAEPSLGTKSPDREIEGLAGRPLYLVHGLADSTILPHHAADLTRAAAKGGTRVDPWLVPAAEHTEAMFTVTARYEAELVAFFCRSIGAPSGPAGARV